MPTTATIAYNGGRLDPVMNADDAMASMISVKLPASVVYAAGTVLGELTASPGTYKAYASGNADGSQNPAVILAYPATTDANGNVTDEWGGIQNTISAYSQGMFRLQDLTGLDANAVTKMAGRIVEGAIGGTGILLI